MPNRANITRPIVLIGVGRSGTSLVSRLFDLHPECSMVGETANLIFGPWQAVAVSSSTIAPLVEHDRWVSEDERAGRVVRETFLTCFPDDRAYWMQKPIGVPRAVADRFENIASAEAAAWYWRVMQSAFPDARFIGILRHPCDVVLSGREWWGFSESSLWFGLAALSGYLTHPDSPVHHVLRYERLVADPDREVRALCDAAEIPFHPEMLAGFDDVHVPVPGREKPGGSGYSRRDDWSSLDPAQFDPAHRLTISAAFERFGGAIDWPTHLDTLEKSSADVTVNEVDRLRMEVGQLARQIERLMYDHADDRRKHHEAWQAREHEFAARERELGALWVEQKAWIEELERVKAWLEQQVANWRELAEKR